MSDPAGIRTLARNLARQETRPTSAQVRRALGRAVKPEDFPILLAPLWRELDSHLDHNPRRGLALAYILSAIAKQSHSPELLARTDLALIRALNACGEFKQTLGLCEQAARRFEKLGDYSGVACVWLEAAWAAMWLGELKTTEDYLGTAGVFIAESGNDKYLRARYRWIQARVLLQHGSLKKVVSSLEQSHRELSPLNRLEAARVLRDLGHAYSRLDPNRAFGPLRKARAIFLRAGCPHDAAICDLFLVQTWIDLNRFEQAERTLIRAQRVFRKLQLDTFDALCNLEFGFLAMEREQWDRSLRYSQQALATFSRIGAVHEQLSCGINIGWALMRLNRYPEALAQLERAAKRALAEGRQIYAAVAFDNMGIIYEKQGRYAQALEYHQRVHEIYAVEKRRKRLVENDLGLGQLYLQLGDLRQAHLVLGHARRICRHDKIWASLATCELARATVLYQQHHFVPAHRTLRAARRLFAKTKQTTSLAFCERLLARLESGEPALARKHLASSRATFRTQKLVVEVALCDLYFADLALEWGEWSTAMRALQRAERVLGASFPDQAWRISYGFAQVAQAQNETQKARAYYLQAAEMLARLRGDLRLENLSNVAFQPRRYALDDGLAFMQGHNLYREALTLLETAKAQTFLHTLAVREWRTASDTTPHERELAVKAQALRFRLEQARARQLALPATRTGNLARQVKPGPAAAPYALAYLARLERDYERVVEQQRLERQGLSGVPALGPFDLAAFRATANARWGHSWNALNYYFANGQLYILWVTPDREHLCAEKWSSRDRHLLGMCTATEPETREMVYRGTIRGFSVPTKGSNLLEQLGRRLIPPQLLELDGEQTLLIAPHGLLHQLPFHALRVQNAPLLDRFTMIYTPNLQAFTQLAEAHQKRNTGGWLLYGASTFGGRAEELKHTRSEVEALEELAPAGTTALWQETATRAQLLDWNRTNALARYRVLHFATHAIVEPGAPHTSRILLGDQDLTVLDVMDLKLSARLVTLSACSTAIGKGGSGDEWLGLTRAFLYAGARTLIASLWQVDDKSTAELMQSFYQNLLAGQEIAQALRNAQRSLHAKGYPAHHWAPFMVLGAG